MEHQFTPATAAPARVRWTGFRISARNVVTALIILLVASGCSAPVAGFIAPRTVETGTATPGWLHTDGGTIRDSANNPYVIKGVSWFGLETPECVPHGLWTINLNEGMKQIKGMGFNTIRLPYSNECIASGEVGSVDYWVNRDLNLQGKTPLQVMDVVIDKAEENGLNVILDRHRPDSASQSELWYTPAYSEATWIADWTMLAARYRNNPTVIGVDLHNEPAGPACWGCGNPTVDWKLAATRAADAVLSVNPNLLIVVEGIENESDGSSTWWGGGLKGVAAHPLTLDVDNRVVYSPHDYPGSVYQQEWFGDSDYPANLPGVWDANWGYIAKQGIAPVLLGEFGTKLETSSDAQWLDEMVSYLHDANISFSYWSFNPNSSDTGGLVKSDWRSPETAKLEALAPLLSAAAPPLLPTAGLKFADVGVDHTFHAEIAWLAESGVSKGWVEANGTRTYRPDGPVLRDAMAAFLYRLSGSPRYAAPAESLFADVSPDQLFYKEMSWLASTGVSNGWQERDGTRTYRPGAAVSRDAMAAFMYRLAGKPAYAPPTTSAFSDVSKTSAFFKEMSWLASTGISNGWRESNGTKTYRSTARVDRGAMAAFMFRYAKKF